MNDFPHKHGADSVAHGSARPFVRLRQLLQFERRDLAATVIYAFAIAVLSLATPIGVEALVNTVAFGVLLWPVVVIALVLMSCLGLAAAIRAMQVYVIECLQRRLFVRVAEDYARRLPQLRIDALDGHHGPDLANRFFDVLTVQKSLAVLLLDGVAIVVTALVGMVVLAFYHPFLLGFDVALLLAMCVLLFGLGRGGIRTSLRESHAKYDVAGWLEELLRCPRAFKFAGGSRLAMEKADQLASEYIDARKSHFRVVWRQTLFALGLQVIASTALLGLGGWLVINRQLTLGQLVASELIVALVVASVAKLGKYAETFFDLTSGAEKLGLLTDLPLERQDGETPRAAAEGMGLKVHVVSHSSFRTRPVVHDFAIAPGERVAVVGPHGSGKTRLFEVLLGLRDPERGHVLLDGVDLRSLGPEALRDQAALVGGFEIFMGTLAENVRVGRAHLTPSDIRDALQVVSLLEVVHTLPQGLDTPLTPAGRPLSAGEQVRLMIARALVGMPRLLILDGVLDALDLRECPELLPRLFERSAPWTLLIATADPDIIQRCDRVIDLAESAAPALPADRALTAGGRSG